jgi:hypothetical protein
VAGLARALEFLGLVVVALGLVVGVAQSDVRRELLLLAIGAAIFVAGYLFSGRGEKP